MMYNSEVGNRFLKLASARERYSGVRVPMHYQCRHSKLRQAGLQRVTDVQVALKGFGDGIYLFLAGFQ